MSLIVTERMLIQELIGKLDRFALQMNPLDASVLL